MTLSHNFLDHIKGDQNRTRFIDKISLMPLHKSEQINKHASKHLFTSLIHKFHTDSTLQQFLEQHSKYQMLPCSLNFIFLCIIDFYMSGFKFFCATHKLKSFLIVIFNGKIDIKTKIKLKQATYITYCFYLFTDITIITDFLVTSHIQYSLQFSFHQNIFHHFISNLNLMFLKFHL